MIGPVEVRVVENWQANSFDVFVFPRNELRENAQPLKIFRHLKGDGWTLEDVGETLGWTGRPTPSFSVPSDVMEALLLGARKIVPSMDRDDAVTDARATRDRLLALVEHWVKT